MAKSKIDFKAIEDKWRKFWEKNGIFRFDPKHKGKVFSIDTPPPYISGKMHIGHAFSYSQQDFIIRFMRMRGRNVFYPFGTDDNGLPTERFIEKLNNVRSRDMGRAEFIKLCLKTLKKVAPEHIQDFKDLGISSDYAMYYSTIDEHSQRVSQRSFIDLVKQGDAYKKNFPTIWCPECQTSIAQAELEDRESGSLFSTLKFKVGAKDLLIATTRPELLPACVAIFVHPKDKRYKKFVGKKAKVPLFDFEVPILEDESAEIDKGTGVLMICSYGDRFDVDAINKHKLEAKIILNKDGTLKVAGYEGLKIKAARKKILADLESAGLVKEKKDISHVVNCHDKGGTAIESLPTQQWSMKIIDKKKKYDNWVKGLEWDWSISRNRHFGVPIPVWECECGEVILPSEKELPVDPLQTKKKCGKCGKNAVGEKMVLDTWATSSLTPQIAIELPGAKGKVKLPMSLRPQGHDIIRTWAFYTIVKAYLHEKKIPWEDIAISGNVSLKGEKMSKSKGNVVKPQAIMDEYGSDALRFWAAGSKLGNDLDYQEKDLVAGKKTVNKLLNASRFVFMNLKGYGGKRPKKLVADDEEFLGKLNEVINLCTKSFEKYQYSRAKQEVEQFFWSDFCDNYLESVKTLVYKGKGPKKLSAQYTLYRSLLSILKMFAPIMPFITEEIYQEHFRKLEKDQSIHVSGWPKAGKEKYKGDWEILKKNISKMRQTKSGAHISLNAPLDAIILTTKDHKIIKPYEERFKTMSGAALIETGKEFKIKFPKAKMEGKK